MDEGGAVGPLHAVSSTAMLRRCTLFAALFLSILAAPATARADAAACIASSDDELALRKAGKLHDALKQLLACSAPACPAEIRTDCASRAAELDAATPSVVFIATDAAGNDLVDVHVSVDGTPIASRLDGSAVILDPGTHTIRFESAGQPPLEKMVLVSEGEKARRVSVVLGAPTVPVEAAPPPVAPPPHRGLGTQRTMAIAAAGVGVVAAGIGAAFGVAASSDWSDAKSACSTKSCPSATRGSAESEHDDAVTAGAASTTAFIVGAVGVAAGVVLWVTAPKGEKDAPAPAAVWLRVDPLVATRGGGFSLGGTF